MKRKRKAILPADPKGALVTNFTSVHYWKTESATPGNRRLGEATFLARKEDINALLAEDLVSHIGTLEERFMRNNQCMVVTDLDVDITPHLDDREFLQSMLRLWYQFEIRLWILGCWCVKDNSITTDHGYSVVRVKGRIVVVNSWPSGSMILNSSGRQEPTQWCQDEQDQANLLTGEIKTLLKDHCVVACETEVKSTFATNDRPRVPRFLFHILDVARHQYDLAFRITYFVQALEILLGTSTSELTYRLSLRLAFLLGKDGDQKRQIFDTMKRCYGIRSTMIHGDVFTSKRADELPELSQRLEDLVRDIARKILTDKDLQRLFNLDSQKLEQAFTDALFENRLPTKEQVDK